MPELIKNLELTVTIEDYNSSGDGVARVDGQVVFVKGAIRGEECRIRILKVLRNVAFAKPVGITRPSPHRIAPVCEGFGKCGGCDFLHMDYEEELALKRLRVEDALRRIGGLDIAVPPVVGSALQSGYRNKAIYAVGCTGGKPAAGFFRERSHDIVPASSCPIQADVSHRAVEAVTRWMELYRIPCYDEKTGKGAVRHIFCRYAFATGSAQVTIVTADGCMPHIDKLVSIILEHCPETASIVLNTNKTRGNTVLAGSFRTVWGEAYITDELCSLKYRLSPRSFYQINRAQAERLYDKTVELASLTKNDTALDLYCGAGTITLLLTRYAGRVIGAEIVKDAVLDARKNAELNGVANVEFICADASQAAETLSASGVTPTAVIVDPPRKGLSAGVIGTIAGMSPRRVVYVSCDPATLARDLKLFSALGYMTVSVTPFDMFPRCAHVECVVLMSRKDG